MSSNFRDVHSTNPADLRAALARVQLPIYVLAGRVRIHPTRLAAMLRGKVPIPPDITDRILAAVREETKG